MMARSHLVLLCAEVESNNGTLFAPAMVYWLAPNGRATAPLGQFENGACYEERMRKLTLRNNPFAGNVCS